MRILVNDYAGHPFQLQLSRELAKLGHTVLHTYFAAYQTPKGNMDDDGMVGLSIMPIQIEGGFSQFSVLSRRRADAAYGRAVSTEMQRFEPDVVLSANTPLDAQRVMLKTAHRLYAKFIFWLQDLLSSAVTFVLRRKKLPFAVAVGFIYAQLERRLLQKSDAVICIAPEFRKQLEDWGVARNKTFVIENWAPLEEIPVCDKATDFRRENNLSDKFCFMYSGTLGMKHKPEVLLALARHFSADPHIVLVVIAQGAGSTWLKKEVDLAGLTNCRLLPFQPYERHAEILASADVLITLLDEACGTFAVPSKLLAYMCAGRPQLVAAPALNLASQIIERSCAGLAVTSSVSEVVTAAQSLASSKEQLRIYAANARAYAEATFRIDAICDRFLTVLSFASSEGRLVTTAHPPSRIKTPTPIR